VPIAPAPEPSAAAVGGPAPLTAPAREVETAAVESVLAKYRTAFANLDASAVAAFWPSVDSRTLSRAFDQLEVQKFEFDRCTTDVRGTTAAAICNGRAQFTPRVGNKTPRVEPRRWAFTLEKIQQTWVIRRVESTRGS